MCQENDREGLRCWRLRGQEHTSRAMPLGRTWNGKQPTCRPAGRQAGPREPLAPTCHRRRVSSVDHVDGRSIGSNSMRTGSECPRNGMVIWEGRRKMEPLIQVHPWVPLGLLSPSLWPDLTLCVGTCWASASGSSPSSPAGSLCACACVCVGGGGLGLRSGAGRPHSTGGRPAGGAPGSVSGAPGALPVPSPKGPGLLYLPGGCWAEQ